MKPHTKLLVFGLVAAVAAYLLRYYTYTYPGFSTAYTTGNNYGASKSN